MEGEFICNCNKEVREKIIELLRSQDCERAKYIYESWIYPQNIMSRNWDEMAIVEDSTDNWINGVFIKDCTGIPFEIFIEGDNLKIKI